MAELRPSPLRFEREQHGYKISGKTYEWRGYFCHRVGAKWYPDEKVWRVPLCTDFSAIRRMYHLQGIAWPLPVDPCEGINRTRGPCCPEAKHNYDRDPCLPLEWMCPKHGKTTRNVRLGD
jgi:hypothetical protein